ncbi:MAG: alpha-L-fucosidase [Clostridia bacterium]|nr:alpha-L-fucosidase [Clostridia bacterium]
MVTMPKRFGMFVHWGPYALYGWQEQIRMRRGIGRAEYARTAAGFNPQKYDPEAWVLMAKEAGMEYICFTTKHHDGFCMWNTAQTDFNIVKTSGRDVLAELAEACRKHGLALSLYYSIPDWNHPCGYNSLSTHQCEPEAGDTPDSEAYREYVRAQVKELLTGYGPIYTWFWDIPPKIDDPSMNEYVRSLQPGILINDRGWSEGDFSTPERSVPDGDTFPRFTEACQSVGAQSWGYRENEDWFTPAFLAQSMDKILLMGGSYLLNVGPDKDGMIPERAVQIVRKVGQWYQAIREAFSEGVIPSAVLQTGAAWTSNRENTWYLHTKNSLISSGLSLAPWNTMPKEAVLLNTGEEVECIVETYPEDYTGTFGVNRPAVLHLRSLPVSDMPLVIRLIF